MKMQMNLTTVRPTAAAAMILGGSPTFSVEEIKDLSLIADRLRLHSDPVSAFLWKSLSNPEQILLGSNQPSERSLRQVQDVVVQALNKLIGQPCIYKPGRFRGVSLRPETTDLIKQRPTGPDLARLNRLLLEDAYPLELSRNLFGMPNPRPPTIPERSSEAAGAAHFDSQAKPDDSAQFRADILRRYEAPFTLAWRHGGLNE
jgi:hypothetical protein